MSTILCPPCSGLRFLAALCSLVVALLLGACGPGVGGTGTGETQAALAHFGATPASACGSDLAPLLSCTPGNMSAAPAPGWGPVHLADTIDGRRVLVRAEGSQIELSAPCARLQFSGEWGVIAAQAGRYYGFAAVDGAAMPATLVVQASGAGLLFTLRDESGRLLLGPVLTVVVAAPAAPGGCG